MGIIYILTSPESKSYIGQTIQKFNKRLNDHKNGNPYCRKLKEAIEIFGLDKFKKDILWEGDNDILDEMEKKYINQYNTLYPNGYNLSSGGGRGEHRSYNTIRLMTKKQRECTKNKNNGLLGYIKENISKVNGRTTSWTFSYNRGRIANFKTKEEALEFQIKYTKDPDKFNSQRVKTRVANGKGGVYKKRNKWIVSIFSNGKNKYYGTYETQLEAIKVKNSILHT